MSVGFLWHGLESVGKHGECRQAWAEYGVESVGKREECRPVW